MGTWGAGSFDNDDALGWIDEFVNEPSRDFIAETLETAVGSSDDDLDPTTSSMAVAAAECVAAVKNGSYSKLKGNLEECLINNNISADQKLVNLAIGAIKRIKTNSDLKELWEEAGADQWSSAINDLEERLKKRSYR